MKSSILAVSFAVVFSTARAFAFGPSRCVKVSRSGPIISPIYDKSQVLSLAPQRRTVTALASEDDTGEISTMGASKVEGRKKRVILGYKAMALAYLCVGLNSAVRGGVTTNFLHMFAGYLAMPTGLSVILADAASHDRLNSDTYKRVNMAMLAQGLLGLVVVSLGTRLNLPFIVAFGLTCINTVKGYTYGVMGLEKQGGIASLVNELKGGSKSLLGGFFTLPTKPIAILYQVATYSVSVMKLIKMKEIYESLQSGSPIAASLARLNRLILLSLMSYTLKDAADRNRLGGSTFIKLNYLSAVGFVINAMYNTGGVTTPFGAIQAFFAAFFGFNGLASYMRNQYA